MKILITALDLTYNFTVPLLEAEGHEVRLLTHDNKVPLISGRGRDYVLAQIAEFEPALVINAIPAMSIPTSSDYTYLGNTDASAKLETHKWETREKADELGWNLPTVLEECVLNDMLPVSGKSYLKVKGFSTMGTIQIPSGTTHNDVMPPGRIAAYVEADLTYEYAIDCYFTISGGAYHITRISGYSSSGTGDEKAIYASGDWTSCCTLVDLPAAALNAFRAQCVTWLDYVVTLGGNYTGNLGGAVTASNEVYWFEQNSRPANHAIGFRDGTVQDWIDGLSTDPTKSPYTLYETET